MSKYTFTFKKDNIFVEFITEDKDVIERQFQIWVAAADDYAKNGVKSIKGKTINSLTTEEKKPSKTEEKIIEPKPEPEIKQEEPIISEPQKVEPEVMEQPAQEQPQAEVIDKASTLLRTINTIQTPESQESAEEEKADFSSVLEEKIENPTFEPTKSQDPIFMNLINSKQTTDKFHYLMITAYYLSEFEKLEKFSLKQINSKLMQNLSEVIDHAMLQDAINQNFIEVIPDLTGVAEVAEYRITRAGEEFFANQIG